MDYYDYYDYYDYHEVRSFLPGVSCLVFELIITTQPCPAT